ncbi:glycosyltransferase family 21 protein [Patellaria atrata CBS 101060]|uniref:Ceramide glucosyltransferase n=1 Tax=Patellaria atrata CBS 101060 TaxID=1346257 RepID=A0A9P4SGS2_9PEZI|nr:glycosyltransferase family 21 protein [Patellaria atrata CBS 101060]
MVLEVFAIICLIWYIAVAIVCTVGYIQIRRHYSSPRAPASCTVDNDVDPPHITVIRPIKGLEPSLYDCLAATFQQRYPRDKLTIYLCVSTRDDASLRVLEQLLKDFPGFDARILIEDEDPALREEDSRQVRLGPNPKIRNMSRAYREAKGDLIWIIDCNVWVGKGAAGRMVDTLCGYGGNGKNKFVHHLPLVIDTLGTATSAESRALLSAQDHRQEDVPVSSTSTANLDGTSKGDSAGFEIWKDGGGRLEELFMSSSHAKFYTAINTVLLAPCIVGKSNMFRRSHLDALTRTNPSRAEGIDFFSDNICEDHLIGDLLWKNAVPEEKEGEQLGKHAMVFGDLALQPMAHMAVEEYVARRVRWLRVRKFTVTLATLVEPGTESLLCSLYGAFAVTTIPWVHSNLHVSPTWTAFAAFWLLSVSIWAAFDWSLYRLLHSAASIEVDEDTPAFARPPKGFTRRTFLEWFPAWFGREALAFPIWFWAFWGGVTVTWRGKRFWVGVDMKVHEIKEGNKRTETNEDDNVGGGIVNGEAVQGRSKKARRD